MMGEAEGNGAGGSRVGVEGEEGGGGGGVMGSRAPGGAEPLLATVPCVRCGKPARLQCPRCLERKLPRKDSAFCSQECFKESWTTHKLFHKARGGVGDGQQQAQSGGGGAGKAGEQLGGGGASLSPGGGADVVACAALSRGWLYCIKKGQRRTQELPSFEWTGSLRPYPISQFRPVPAHIPKPEWAATGFPEIEMRSRLQSSVEIKTPEQIDGMRKACRAAREVLDAAARVVAVGVTTDEIDRVVHEKALSLGAYPSPLNYHFFPKSCCTSVNEIICHGIPDARPLQDGDLVNVDVTVYLNGFHGDLNETYFVGNADEATKKLVRITYESLEKAIAIVRPGVRFREVGEVINRHVSLAGFSVVKSYCGHGIGELFHCAPNIPHYAKNKAVGVMKAGQTFTIEPMINAGTWRDKLWPDGWTAVTADGQRSAQFEQTLLVTETGVEVLTGRLPTSPKVFPWL
ncbi:hypothetical protein CBR_g18681 [Chara braunii]|uniref:Methionine aminopeptidase n=1 Tax=Chara braunii TaxID=69332 RepID=A0A388KW29_CHABU|nr:hypothetical protein CBR_g18681 [Chara braunii]|eukprot:GBG74270.1 hypothetical protein CBR_g18681 [Chara braunii]